jgi:FKBP-type peptidyl-prolyl cis-trans isomerase
VDWQVEDRKVSAGPAAAYGDTVGVWYKVALTEDDLERGHFIESIYDPDPPLEIKLEPGALLIGVERALIGMRSSGSVRRVSVPPSLGFGDRGYKGVPPNVDLVFEITMLAVSLAGNDD